MIAAVGTCCGDPYEHQVCSVLPLYFSLPALHVNPLCGVFSQQSQSSVERLGSGRSGRRRSGAVVHVTKLCDDSNLSLVSAPSTASMQSAYSAAHASDSSQPAAVEVCVRV